MTKPVAESICQRLSRLEPRFRLSLKEGWTWVGPATPAGVDSFFHGDCITTYFMDTPIVDINLEAWSNIFNKKIAEGRKRHQREPGHPTSEASRNGQL
ncbi:hypothetical protein O181_090427 [Austropuccinia psidii MF-1]|uniref:Uncharacterized protein n=1 Tax=Austropuccinia psidii MF-1 TaxID=1389203 RepID=A0A9Q3IVI3_9BASI|nr:hypothetical protein [Austropuccinia psidii MF-1]